MRLSRAESPGRFAQFARTDGVSRPARTDGVSRPARTDGVSRPARLALLEWALSAAVSLVVAGCEIKPAPERTAGTAVTGAAAPTSSGRAPLSAVTGTVGTSPSAVEGPQKGATRSSAVPLTTAKPLVKLETGGCGLLTIEDRYLYARAPSCKEVLKIDRLTGATEMKKLPQAMLVQTVAAGVAYGCPLGASSCTLTAATLDGGTARAAGALDGFIDGPGQSRGTRFAGVFAPLKEGRPDIEPQRFTVETIELGTAARTVLFSPVGTGSVHVAPRGVLFEGALVPKENVGAASWGLWAIEGGAPPKRLGTTRDIASLATDEEHIYYVAGDASVWRLTFDGAREEALTAALEKPPKEAGSLGVMPAIAVAEDAVYVSTATAQSCWIWQFRKP